MPALFAAILNLAVKLGLQRGTELVAAVLLPVGQPLLLGVEELFVPFAGFPWFRDASIRQISHVELPSADHLYWLELDIDLAIESIRSPEKFPLVSRPGA